MSTTSPPRVRRRLSQAAAVIVAALIGAIATIVASRRQVERRDDDIVEIRRTIEEQAAQIEALNAEQRQKDAIIDALRRQLDTASRGANSNGAALEEREAGNTDAVPLPADKPAATAHHGKVPETDRVAEVIRPIRYQEFPQLRVEVGRARVSASGTMTVFLAYRNKTSDTLQLVLCSGFCGNNKTFVIDPDGDRHLLRNASGIAECCYGFYGGDWKGNILVIPPSGEATAALMFEVGRGYGPGEKRGDNAFTLSTEQTLGVVHKSQWRATGSLNIVIEGITP